MVSILWAFLIVIGIIYAFLNGNVSIINESILVNANKALELIISFLPTIVLWTGIMKIAEDAGLLTKFSNFLRPVLSKLFPSVPKDNKALGYIWDVDKGEQYQKIREELIKSGNAESWKYAWPG